jgi:thiamine biosynthesis protein ThiS
MRIKVNNRETEVSDNLNIEQLMSSKHLLEAFVIVDLNGAVIQRRQWERTFLKPDDRLQIIWVQGGG